MFSGDLGVSSKQVFHELSTSIVRLLLVYLLESLVVECACMRFCLSSAPPLVLTRRPVLWTTSYRSLSMHDRKINIELLLLSLHM